MNLKMLPAILLDWKNSSVTEMALSTEESLMLTTNSLPMAGKAFLTPCGSTTWNIVCAGVMPMLRAASVWPTSTDWSPERRISAM